MLLQLLAAATRRDEIAAIVDTFDCLDVASAASAGVELDRLMWIRGHSSPASLVDRSIERALKALNLVLQAGGFGVVAIDFADAPLAALTRIPFTHGCAFSERSKAATRPAFWWDRGHWHEAPAA